MPSRVASSIGAGSCSYLLVRDQSSSARENAMKLGLIVVVSLGSGNSNCRRPGGLIVAHQPSVRVKEEVERVLRGGAVEEAPAEAPMQGFVRALARYILQVSIEEEATTFLGRGHYRRGERMRPGWRNGYEAKRLQTEAGLLELAVPQLRAAPEPSGPHWWSGWDPGPLIWKGWSAGCTCAGCPRRT